MKDNNNLKSVKSNKISRRNLPHWEFPGNTCFITFKTFNDLCLNDNSKDIVIKAIEYYQDKRYKLHACVVMSTHVHMIVTPEKTNGEGFYGLAQIVHGIKSYSANRIQKETNLKGKIWLDERYDRIIRNDDELSEEMSYIIDNPVKDRIEKMPEDYKWLYHRVVR